MTTTSGMTLQEALAFGQGEERPFRCSVHDDRMASASVNVVKGVWFCHACHAKGTVDDKRAPSDAELEAMLRPEKPARVYPAAWLELFNLDPDDNEAYWRTRFPDWVCWLLDLGQDPFTGEATFPVYTPNGRLAGVGRRHEEEGRKFYKYPRGWSASTQMGGTGGIVQPMPVLVIVEGMADAAACLEVGVPALTQWGSMLHAPQVEMVARHNPSLILLGQDMDEAGERGVSHAFKTLKAVAPMKRVRWSADDPAATPAGKRRAALARAVSSAGYGVDVIPQWEAAVLAGRAAHTKAVEEAE